ncbi:hypothetical protein ACI2UC_17550 [Ralstonia nicotianae]|uniref:hypothetical protein n=1 Tax=Ralstonia pseudosolanacearum TaxID=1310165 RepID=UPI002675876F|nr:hypothetical protein [Ralstonia pseudosolanacearum]MDO3530246.1 hypothetical protein [Ralstonia pseudosolanacearum]MDO3533050.1 hypothetical protein [Ralstonia pseudosolanacearum]
MNIFTGVVRDRMLAHVANVLGYENFLCDCVKTRVDFRTGNFYSVDPAGRHIDAIENFSWGGGAGHDNSIARRLLTSLTSSPNRVLVMDDVMGDVSSMENSSVVNDDQIYRWINGANATDQEISRLVWATSVSWHFLAVIFSGGSNVDVGGCIASGECAELGGVVEVVVGAYDGEGFIHWKPD